MGGHIIADAGGIEPMKRYRDTVRQNAVAAGRDPDGIKVLFLANPVIDSTAQAAQDRRAAQREDANRHIEMQLANMSRLTNIDFSQFDPDEKLQDLVTNGHQSVLAKWMGKTPRELGMNQAVKQGLDLTGTADHVAGVMAEMMQEVGGDGFLFFNATFDRRYVVEVCDGLVPALQRRGLTRTQYEHKHFRDNLLAF